MDVYVYADESGHSGKNIFDDRAPTYYQGSIISLGDVDPIIGDVIQRHCEQLNVPRLHSNEHQEHVVTAICEELLDVLDKVSWQFFVCKIHKTYMVPTKFVDLFFDSSDNPAVPFLWYNSELFRHSLCLGVAELLTKEDSIEFWNGFLSDDMPAMLNVAGKLLSRIDRICDPREREVIKDGLEYAIGSPDKFELICTQGKSAYKGQTPNMVAFSSLMAGTHSFCKQHSSSVKELIHDRSDEFRGTMRDYHRIFNKIDLEINELGGPTLFKEAQFNLGTFDLRSSASHPALQAVDVFLWMVQRQLKTESGQAALKRLKQHLGNFEISPKMSKIIVRARTFQFNNMPVPAEKMKKTKRISAKLEANRKKHLVRK